MTSHFHNLILPQISMIFNFKKKLGLKSRIEGSLGRQPESLSKHADHQLTIRGFICEHRECSPQVTECSRSLSESCAV